jgi:hypothetical protein
MTRLLLILLAVGSLAAQESTLPEGDVCMNHAPRPNQKHMHECHCDYTCIAGPDGGYDIQEGTTCKLYCRRPVNLCVWMVDNKEQAT